LRIVREVAGVILFTLTASALRRYFALLILIHAGEASPALAIVFVASHTRVIRYDV
jgi:hypothetical protein